MGGVSQDTEIALLKRDVEDLNEKIDVLTIAMNNQTTATNKQTEAMARTKGILFGATLVVSAIWSVVVAAVAYFK